MRAILRQTPTPPNMQRRREGPDNGERPLSDRERVEELLTLELPSTDEGPATPVPQPDPYWWIRTWPCVQHLERPEGGAGKLFDEKERLKRKSSHGNASESDERLLRHLCYKLRDGCCFK